MALIDQLKLLEPAELREMAIPARRVSGVYILLDKDEIVYVGKSNNVHARVVTHITDFPCYGQFDSYAVVETQDELDLMEIAYITKYKPKFNRQYMPKDELISMPQRSGKPKRLQKTGKTN